jgi:3-oxoacyl-[acyl-carrier-protein] synthase-3
MAFIKANNFSIAGIAAAVPEYFELNIDYPLFTKQEANMFIKTVGVKKRHIGSKNRLTTSDLAFIAAEKLLNALSWQKKDVDFLLFVSQSPDYYLPATAIILQNRLQLPTSTIAFDIGLGCSGYINGLFTAAQFLQTGQLKKGLVIAGDVSSYTINKEDKSTYPLFGDAATVTAVEYNNTANPAYFDLHSDGSGYEAIIIRDGGTRNLITEDSFKVKDFGNGIKHCNLEVALDGMKIFNFSITTVPKSIKTFLDNLNVKPNEIDFFVMHQANLLMNEMIRKKLHFEKNQTPYSIAKYGNTSSASIPLTICSEIKDTVTVKSSKLLLSGFGVGLSWANAYIDTQPMVCLPIIEV